MSPNVSERPIGTDTICIILVWISRDTSIPNKLVKFWSSEENKVNLQRLVRDIVFHRPGVKPVIMARSIVNDGIMLPAKVSSSEDMPDITSCI